MLFMQVLLWIGVWAAIWYGLLKLAKSKGLAGWVGHLAGSTLGLLFSLVVIGLALPNPGATEGQNLAATTGATAQATPQSAPRAQEAEAVIRVSAVQLFKAYHANEVSADVKYRDKALVVSGSVMDITKDIFDNVSVSLRTPNEFMPARAQVDESEHEKAGALRRGQQVTLACSGGGMLVGSPVLDDCRLL